MPEVRVAKSMVAANVIGCACDLQLTAVVRWQMVNNSAALTKTHCSARAEEEWHACPQLGGLTGGEALRVLSYHIQYIFANKNLYFIGMNFLP